MSRLIDLTGLRFSRLLVLKRVENHKHSKSARFECLCDCGKTRIVGGYALRMGEARSCGCLRDRAGGINKKREGFYWSKDKKGRRMKYVRADKNPRASNGFVKEALIVVEKAIGKFLPKGAIIHHINGDPADNTTTNLAVLQNNAHHRLIHKRTNSLQRRIFGAK